MAEEIPAPATAPAKTAKTKKKPAAKKATNGGTSLPKLIVQLIAESKERKGMSVTALKKALARLDVDVVKLNKRINTALINLVYKEILVQTSGIGASGSFKLAKKEPTPKKPKDVKKKPAARKATTTASKKSTPVKKRTAVKAEKKTKKVDKKVTPKKAKKSASSPKKAASKPKPKAKAKKETPKKGKKPAPKKSPARKAARKPAAKRARK
ncbi:histone H1-like [Syngnathus acus]|uniref:histone H1-like n=1 Tax=Syngnathus acus TaxID=161584 RepID=UPI001885D216|nr:histone H1-like [Syngnathus acus]